MESGIQYDPLEAPEPEEWLAIDEAERIHLAQDYHRRTRVRLPNEKLHAVFHVRSERNERSERTRLGYILDSRLRL